MDPARSSLAKIEPVRSTASNAPASAARGDARPDRFGALFKHHDPVVVATDPTPDVTKTKETPAAALVELMTQMQTATPVARPATKAEGGVFSTVLTRGEAAGEPSPEGAILPQRQDVAAVATGAPTRVMLKSGAKRVLSGGKTVTIESPAITATTTDAPLKTGKPGAKARIAREPAGMADAPVKPDGDPTVKTVAARDPEGASALMSVAPPVAPPLDRLPVAPVVPVRAHVMRSEPGFVSRERSAPAIAAGPPTVQIAVSPRPDPSAILTAIVRVAASPTPAVAPVSLPAMAEGMPPDVAPVVMPPVAVAAAAPTPVVVALQSAPPPLPRPIRVTKEATDLPAIDAGDATSAPLPQPIALAPIAARLDLDPAKLAAAPAIDTNRAEWIEKMVGQVAEMRDAIGALGEGGKSTVIRLLPDALGAIDVRIARNEAGVTQVSFASDNPHARQLLADAAPKLVEMAEARGLKFDQANVGGGQTGARQPSSQGQPQSRQPESPLSAKDADPRPAATTAKRRERIA